LVHVRFSHGIEADVQVGPVIRGTAVRDALPFIRFSDFANQIEFALVASALNDHALEQLRHLPAPAALVGQRLRVVGALSRSASSWEITPITVEVMGTAE
jgi:predicted lipoprotein